MFDSDEYFSEVRLLLKKKTMYEIPVTIKKANNQQGILTVVGVDQRRVCVIPSAKNVQQ